MKCSIEGCEKPEAAKGWCWMHWGRWRSHGTPHWQPSRAPDGAGTITPKGYRRITLPDGRAEFEHRHVWEQANGPIPAGYHVHHKNHDRLDNRLENLEILPASVHSSLHKPRITFNCAVEGCTRLHKANGFCTKHNDARRWRATHPIPRGPKVCTVEGCERRHVARGFCQKHYDAKKAAFA